MKLISEEGQRYIDAQLRQIIALRGTGLAMHHDADTGSLIKAVVVDGEITGWSVTGPYTTEEAATIVEENRAKLATEGLTMKPAALESVAIN